MLTDYEQRREARIARNREILLSLVGNLPEQLTGAEGSSGGGGGGGGGSKAGSKRVRASGGGDTVDPADIRRSGRIRNQPAPIYTSFEVDEDLGDAHARATQRAAKRAAAAAAKAAGLSTTPREMPPKVGPGRCRQPRHRMPFTEEYEGPQCVG
jgi:hypothetical protein